MLQHNIEFIGADSESSMQTTASPASTPDWRLVDRALREIRTRKSELAADEARWLREAEAVEIWRPLGMVSILDYLERVMGYAPRTAQDRLRVARALGALPQLTAALASDTLTYSAVREITRVATPATESAWVKETVGKNLREIEELVVDRHPGDRPDDPPDPTARRHVVRFELAAETYALLRQARSALDDEHGTNLSDDGFITALCSGALEEPSADHQMGGARFQIALTVCERCRKGWQHGAGASIPVEQAAVERAMCDAQHIGSIEGAEPERAYQDIPPRVARLVRRRDGGRCRVDGCRSARGLELHHIVHRADGGSHDASNIILTCSACHHAHHAGLLALSGTADQLTVRRPALVANDGNAGRCAEPGHVSRETTPTNTDNRGLPGAGDSAAAPSAAAHGRIRRQLPTNNNARPGSASTPEGFPTHSNAHVDASSATQDRPDAPDQKRAASPIGTATGPRANSSLDLAVLRTETKLALTGLGWQPAVANTAIAAALSALGTHVSLEQLIRESLRRCPMPRC